MVMKAAMMEREKRIQEVKQERGKKKEIDPTLLQYQQQVPCTSRYAYNT